MAKTMKPEQTRHERFIEYVAALRERFAENLLSELQQLNQCLVWKGELEAGKRKKVSYNPNYRLARASVKSPTSWGSLDAALHVLETGNYTGLGFMLTPPLVMVDLDHSYDRQGGAITDLQEIIQSLNSYTEASPGNGLHALAYGTLPGKNIHIAIEMYGQNRFTTITTNHLEGSPMTIEQHQQALEAVYQQFRLSLVPDVIQNTRGEARQDLPGYHGRQQVIGFCKSFWQGILNCLLMINRGQILYSF